MPATAAETQSVTVLMPAPPALPAFAPWVLAQRQRWRAGDELGQPAKVLRDRCPRELELSAARPTQSQTPKPQNALEMGTSMSHPHLPAQVPDILLMGATRVSALAQPPFDKGAFSVMLTGRRAAGAWLRCDRAASM